MIRVVAKANKHAEILIHEAIGQDWFGDGLTSKRFASELKQLGDVDQIKLRINSPGGSVSDGVAIYNTLKSHGAKISVVVEGLAASIASIIAMAGDEIVMGEGSLMMIHSPWTIAMGSAEDMRETAEVLDKFESALIDIYASRSGHPRKDIEKMLKAETWLSGEEAVSMGFAHSAMDGGDKEAKASVENDHREAFKKFATEFRQPADVTPQRIAAALFPSATAESQEMKMTDEEKRVAEAAQNAQVAAAVSAAVAAERAKEQERQSGIRALFEPFMDGHRTLMDTCISDINVTAEVASTKLLKAVADDQAGPLAAGRILPGKDSREKFLAGAQQALLARSYLDKKDPANEYNGMSLSDLAARALSLSGVNVNGMSKDQIARKVLATHTTSDFALLTAATANKALLAAYAEMPTTWQLWAKKGSVPDFKANTRLSLGSFSNLLTIPEGGEYKQGTLSEAGNTLQATTKGRYIELSRQLIVNDDLGAFIDKAGFLGRAARRTVESDVYTSLTSASGAGPTMADTGALFNATAVTTAGGHANLTASGTAISIASLNVGSLAMRAQKDIGNQDFAGFRPKFLLVPPGKEYLAWELLNSVSDPSQSNPAKRNFAQTMNLTVISSDYLSGNAWYLIADPSVAPLYEVAFLDGNDTPFIDEEVEFLTDALRMKVRLDYGVAPIEFRAGYRNAGA